MVLSVKYQYISISDFTQESTSDWINTDTITCKLDIENFLSQYVTTPLEKNRWGINYKNFANSLTSILKSRPSLEDLFLAIEILKDWDCHVIDLVLEKRIVYGDNRLRQLKEDLYENFEGYFENRDDYAKKVFSKEVFNVPEYLIKYIMWDKVTAKLEANGVIQILTTGCAEYFVFSNKISTTECVTYSNLIEIQ